MKTERELDEMFMKQLEAADEAGVKLEVTEGLPTWEFFPNHRHQATEARLLRSVRSGPDASGCVCYPLSDVYIKFPDGSLKRPDLAIFCQIPREQVTAIKLVPKAIVEIVSSDTKKKDYELNPPFYLKHGVLDVIVIDPSTKQVTLFTAKGHRDLKSPQTLTLQCGCLIDV